MELYLSMPGVPLAIELVADASKLAFSQTFLFEGRDATFAFTSQIWFLKESDLGGLTVIDVYSK